MSDSQSPFDEEMSAEWEIKEQTAPDNPDVEGDTIQPVKSGFFRLGAVQREIATDTAGNRYLVYSKRTRTRPPRERRFSRRPKVVESWINLRLLLANNKYVNQRLVEKHPFEPTEDEEVILAFTRLHWWSHGLAQVGLIAGALALTIGAFWVESQPIMASASTWIGVAWIVLMLLIGISYLAVWIPWAYTVLIVTNRRMILSYAPPFSLVGEQNSVNFVNLRKIDFYDQGRFKLLPSLGNLLPKVGITGYKIVQGETSANDEPWISKGIRFVRDGDEIVKFIQSEIAKSLAAAGERHAEDMQYQSKMVELLQDIDRKLQPEN